MPKLIRLSPVSFSLNIKARYLSYVKLYSNSISIDISITVF